MSNYIELLADYDRIEAQRDALLNTLSHAVKQRDELLAALKASAQTLRHIEGYVSTDVFMSRTALGIGAKNAIIRAESVINSVEETK